MHAVYTMAALAAWGVQFGWQPIGGGGIEYIVQIEPHTVATFANGDDIVSELPRDVRDLRRIRLTVGDGPLLNQGVPLPTTPAMPPVTGVPQLGSGPANTMPGPLLTNPIYGTPTLTATDTTTPSNRLPMGSGNPPAEEDGRYSRQSGSGSTSTAANRNAASSNGGANSAPESSLVWEPLTRAFALFMSLGANIFLSWIVWSQRERYRMLLDQRTGASLLA